MDNIFAQYPIQMPLDYQEKIKGFVSTGSSAGSRENSPFDRQVDFWFMSVCLAFRKNLEPIKVKDTYNAITAEILSRDQHRVVQLQMIALSVTKDPNILTQPKSMLDVCIGLANAGIPLLLTILSDIDQTPLWNLYDELDSLAKAESNT